MIIAHHVSNHPTKPGTLHVEFNCIANESTPLFMEIDTVYVFMRKGETVKLDLPASMNLQQGDQVPLSGFASAYTQQVENWNLAWTRSELPEPSGLQP